MASKEIEDLYTSCTTPYLQGVCKDCGNGTLNNDLTTAFGFNGDEGYAGGDTLVCLVCGSTHLDIL